jgi:hypothetical protein
VLGRGGGMMAPVAHKLGALGNQLGRGGRGTFVAHGCTLPSLALVTAPQNKLFQKEIQFSLPATVFLFLRQPSPEREAQSALDWARLGVEYRSLKRRR